MLSTSKLVKGEAVIFLEPKMAFCDWAMFESIDRGFINSQVRFPSEYISFEALERFLLKAMLKYLLSLFTSLRRTAGLSKKIYFERNHAL